MADRYWVGGTGTWDASDTTHWAASSGGAGGESVPTSSDNVTFDLHSNEPTDAAFTCTLSGTRSCGDFNVSYIGTTKITLDGSGIYIYGNLNLSGGTTQITWDDPYSTVTMKATSGTKTINGNGISFYDFTIDGSGGIFQLTSELNIRWVLRLTNGTFDANGQTILYSSSYSGVGLYGTFTGSSSLYNLSLTPATPTKTKILSISGNIAITNLFTINNGATVTNRFLVKSSTIGTQVTITSASNSFNNVDFQDITGAGAASWDLSTITGGSGDCGGNSGITFTTATSCLFDNVNGGNWSDVANWTNAGDDRVPLPQDDVSFATTFGTSKTITADMPRLGKNIDWTGATWTTALTFGLSSSFNNLLFGSLTFISGLTLNNNQYGLIEFHNRSNATLKSYGCSDWSIYLYNYGTELILLDDLTTQGNIYLYNGTLNADIYNITTGFYTANASTTTKLGSGTWTLTSNNWSMNSSANVICSSSTVKITIPSGNITFTGGSKTYNNLWFDRGTSTGSITITGSNTFNDFKDTGTEAHSILFTAGNTQTVSTFTVSGSAAKLITLNSTTTGVYYLTKIGGGIIQCNYLDIYHSVARPWSGASGADTWFANFSTDHNSDATAGSGWTISASSTSPSPSPSVSPSPSPSVSPSRSPSVSPSASPSKSPSVSPSRSPSISPSPSPGWYTDRYWVGGSGSWNDPNHWSDMSGGTGGEEIPKDTNDVYIDENSGFDSGGLITLNGAYYSCKCKNFTSTSGHNYTIDYVTSDLSIYGSMILESGLTWNTFTYTYLSSTSNETITSNGCIIEYLYFENGTGMWTLLDDLIINDNFRLQSGTFNANNKNITILNGEVLISPTLSTNIVLYMGSGTWEIDSGYGWQLYGTLSNINIYPETSTIKFNNNYIGLLGYFYFYGGNKTYNKLWIYNTGLGYTKIYNSNTFNEIKIESGTSVKFNSGTTQTVGSFIANNITLDTISGTGQFTLSSPKDIIDTCDYLNISNSKATGGALWYAGGHSLDTANNDGWIFADYNLISLYDNMSTQKKPTFRIKSGEPIGIEAFFLFPDLQGYEKSFLETDVIAGVSSFSANGTNFATDDYIVIGQPGSEKTEIIKIATADATTITTSTALVFDHNRGDVIRFIPYNQIVLSRSTDGGVNYSVVPAIDINPESMETFLQRPTDVITDYYRFRFYNETTTNYSSFSDIIVGIGFADNTLFSCKQRALNALGEEKGNLINDNFLNESIREARRTVDSDSRILRWSFRKKFDTNIGTVVPGEYSITAPTDLRDRNTNKNIISLRIGSGTFPLEYQDRQRFNDNYMDIPHTTLNGIVNDSDVTIILTSSGDFDSSGVIQVAGDTIDLVNYTSNSKSTGVISGVTGIVTGGHATGMDIWQEASFGTPYAYTIDSGVIKFDLPFSDDLAGENIWMDYYNTLTEITDDSEEFDEPFYDLYVSYLKWKIKYKKSNGKIDRDTDVDYKDWIEGITKIIDQELSGQDVRFIPS